MGLGSKIKQGVKDRYTKAKIDRERRNAIAKQAKDENYWKSYEIEKRKQATIKGRTDAQTHRGDRLVRAGRDIARQLPTLANPDDPFLLGSGPQGRRKKKRKGNRNMKNYFDNLP